jgi:hypothetical protein
MALARRHYEFIADALKASKPEPHWDANKMAQWDVTVHRFSDACARDNSAFKRDRFETRAGVT